MSKKKLSYRTHNVGRSYKERLELYKHHFVEIETAYVKRFKNCFWLLAKLSKSERLFFDYLTEIMDEDNYVANNKATRDSFNSFMRKLKLETYQESTMHKTFSKLAKIELITAYKGKRGLYQISPLFFYSDKPESDREKLIRCKLEEPNKEPLNKKRHDQLKGKDSS